MGTVVDVDFRKAPPYEIEATIRRGLVEALERSGLPSSARENVSRLVAEQTAQLLHSLDNHRPCTALSVDGELPADVRAVIALVNQQWEREATARFLALLQEAYRAIISAAVSTCVVMANSDRLR